MANRYWVGGTGTWDSVSTTNWAATTGGASGASAPTSADIVFIDANSGGGTITLGADANIVRLDARNSTVSIDWNIYKISINGSSTTVWYSGGITAIGSTEAKVEFTYSGANSRTINPRSGVGENGAISVYVTAGTGSFLISTGSAGILKNLNFTGFSGSLIATSSSASWTIYGDLTLSSTMTMPSQTGSLTMSATSTKTITTNATTINQPIVFNGVGGVWQFQDALTQGSTRAFTITNGTVQLKASATSTVGALVTSGTNQKFLQSTLAGSQATLSQASGTVNTSYLTINDINAVGGATWNSFVNQSNVDAGNNDGWDFGISPVIGGTEYTYQLRSFTQPRRF
jgi:hypothetical protein